MLTCRCCIVMGVHRSGSAWVLRRRSGCHPLVRRDLDRARVRPGLVKINHSDRPRHAGFATDNCDVLVGIRLTFTCEDGIERRRGCCSAVPGSMRASCSASARSAPKLVAEPDSAAEGPCGSGVVSELFLRKAAACNERRARIFTLEILPSWARLGLGNVQSPFLQARAP